MACGPYEDWSPHLAATDAAVVGQRSFSLNYTLLAAALWRPAGAPAWSTRAHRSHGETPVPSLWMQSLWIGHTRRVHDLRDR